MCLHTSLPSHYFQCYKFLIKFKSCFRNAFCNFSFFLFSSLFSLLRAATFWFSSSICFSIAMFRISLLGSIIPACCSTAWFNVSRTVRFYKRISRQSSFLHQLWNADMFLYLPAYLVLLAVPVQFLFTFSLIFLNHLVVFAHILHPILPDSYI